jgi:hypothetical protein
MYNFKPRRKTLTTSYLAIVSCILALYFGVTPTGQNEIFAQDKSTTITCNDGGPCEKTECVNGDCESTATNSSNISSTIGSSDEKESESQKRTADPREERLRMRDD